MKLFFAVMGFLVAALWAMAHLIAPADPHEGQTVLRWSTDPNPARTEQIAPFETDNPNVAVLVEPNTFERTIVQCSTGIGPDLIEIYSVADMAAYVEAGILLDLTEYADELGFGPKTTYPSLAGGIQVEGRQYRYPANAASQVLIYNKRMFREAGIEYPRDGMPWEEFVELVRPLTVAREDGKGYRQFAMVMSRDFSRDIHLQFGGRFFSDDKTACVLDSPESIAGVQWYHDLMRVHNIIPTPESAAALSGEGGWGTGEIRWFATGRAAMIWGSRWMMVQFRQYPELREEIGVALLPCPPGTAPLSYAGARGPGINVNSPRREEAVKFLAYLASDDYGRVIAQSSDALPPSATFARTVENLLNPDYPWETYQEKFVESMNNARSTEISPFVNLKTVDRLWREHIELIENGAMTPERAMVELTKRVNTIIERNVREQPALRERWETLRATRVSMAE